MIDVAEFVRRYHMRSPNIMWFLGAGASVASGIATANDMVWEFKRLLYCTQERVALDACRDLGSLNLRTILQKHFDANGRYPAANSPEEYPLYFEAAYPHEVDRRRCIENLVIGAKPSYGHLVLAALLKLDKARAVWTTNFDRMVEDAVTAVFGTGSKLISSTLDSPDLSIQALNEGRWPLLTKLHGDFQSQRLKNTSKELVEQNEKLRRGLVEGCRRYGLAILGYSGRDESIMSALREAVGHGHGFPAGLFWFYRSDSSCLPSVQELVAAASRAGIDAHLVEIETFDELLGDVLLLVADLPADIQAILSSHMNRVSDAPVTNAGKGWPVVRLNALPVLSFPSTCRRLVCEIGGQREVRDAVSESHSDIIVGRRKQGVIGFGPDSEMRRVFASRGITEFGLHSIEAHRLEFESMENSLLYTALVRALTRTNALLCFQRRSDRILVVDSSKATLPVFTPLRNAVTRIAGTVPGTTVTWAEAVRIRIEYRLDSLWLVFEPTIWTAAQSGENGDEAKARGREFVRERLASRFNRAWNAVVDAWANILTGGQPEAEIRAFGKGDGIDAVFTISRKTAYSRKDTSR
ncbi:MAG: SIR2 family protein [Candidatus Hydrogenedentes bacterium]|nr:SIR2 family protein [Candidatus Hydrogenedentota bacterium]